MSEVQIIIKLESEVKARFEILDTMDPELVAEVVKSHIPALFNKARERSAIGNGHDEEQLPALQGDEAVAGE